MFLQDIDLMTSRETEPPIPSYEHEYDENIENEDEVTIIERDRWEAKNLRAYFDCSMKALAADDDTFAAGDEWEAEMKRNFQRLVWELSEKIAWARDRLEKRRHCAYFSYLSMPRSAQLHRCYYDK